MPAISRIVPRSRPGRRLRWVDAAPASFRKRGASDPRTEPARPGASGVGCCRALRFGAVASEGGRQKHPRNGSSRTDRAPDRRPWRARLVTRPVATRPAGGTDSQYCERCGDVAGEATTLSRIGLTKCSSCAVYACRRCWMRAAGACPGCGFSPAGAAIVAALRSGRGGQSRPQADRTPAIGGTVVTGSRSVARRADRSAAIAVGMTMLAMSVVGVAIAGLLRPAGGVEGIVGTPGTSPVVVAGADGATPSAGGQPRPTARTTSGRGTGTTSTPVPTRTSAPRPVATPGTTPRPTPRPTIKPTADPTPSPTRCVAIAPQLVGQHRSAAERLWRAAGFTGGVTTLTGRGNYKIATQSRTAGDPFGCAASVTVGP
jgi:hypothetical protein